MNHDPTQTSNSNRALRPTVREPSSSDRICAAICGHSYRRIRNSWHGRAEPDDTERRWDRLTGVELTVQVDAYYEKYAPADDQYAWELCKGGHISGIPVRNQQRVAPASHYAVTVHMCIPADPASKGGTESSVKLAKADLVPTDANLRDAL